jgi:hypothetical protein
MDVLVLTSTMGQGPNKYLVVTQYQQDTEVLSTIGDVNANSRVCIK